MFKNLAFMIQNNAFLRVSADTKTWAILPDSCGSPPYPSPAGGFRLPSDKQLIILSDNQI
jgi:hypothetical protein